MAKKKGGKKGGKAAATLPVAAASADALAPDEVPSVELLNAKPDVFGVFSLGIQLKENEAKAWKKIRPHLLAHRPKALLASLKGAIGCADLAAILNFRLDGGVTVATKCLSFICREPLLDAAEVAALLDFVLDPTNGANLLIPANDGYYGSEWFMRRFGETKAHQYCLTGEKVDRYTRALVRDNIESCLGLPFTQTGLSKVAGQYETSMDVTGKFFYKDRETEEEVCPVVSIQGAFVCVRFQRGDDGPFVEKHGDADHAKMKGATYKGALHELMLAAELLGFRPESTIGPEVNGAQELRIKVAVAPENEALFLTFFPKRLITCLVNCRGVDGSEQEIVPVHEADAKEALSQFRAFAESFCAAKIAAEEEAAKQAEANAALAAADARLFGRSFEEVLRQPEDDCTP